MMSGAAEKDILIVVALNGHFHANNTNWAILRLANHRSVGQIDAKELNLFIFRSYFLPSSLPIAYPLTLSHHNPCRMRFSFRSDSKAKAKVCGCGGTFRFRPKTGIFCVNKCIFSVSFQLVKSTFVQLQHITHASHAPSRSFIQSFQHRQHTTTRRILRLKSNRILNWIHTAP